MNELNDTNGLLVTLKSDELVRKTFYGDKKKLTMTVISRYLQQLSNS